MKVQHQGHEHEFEAEFGLPERLPANEQLLWQGSPDWPMLARRVLHIRVVAGYFALLLAWQVVSSVYDGLGTRETIVGFAWMAALAATALGLLAALAALTARTAVYTLTDRRIVMRVGVVLTLTFNLPLARIARADLRLDKGAPTGDIPLTLADGEQIAYLNLWPHARPWRFAQVQPMLRSVPDAQRVARLLATAWAAAQPAGAAVRVAESIAPIAPVADPAMAGSRNGSAALNPAMFTADAGAR